MEYIAKLKSIDWKKFVCFDVFFSLFIFTLPFANAYMYPFIALSFIFFVIEKKYKTISFKANWSLISFTVLVLFLYLQGILNQTLFQDFRFNSKLFLIFFLLVFTLSYRWRGNGNLGEKTFILGVNVSILISLLSIFSFWLNNNVLPLSYGGQVNEMLSINRPYLGIFIVTSIFMLLKNIQLKLWSNTYYSLVVFQVLFLVFISARLALLLTLLILGIHFINLFKNHKKKLFAFFVISLGLIALIVFNPIMQKRFKVEAGTKIDLERTLDFEPRYVIYPCNYSIIKSGIPFFGFSGERELQAQLNQCYTERIDKKKKLDYFLSEEFHTHNAFVNFTFIGGWMALMLFVFTVFYPFISKKFNYETRLMLVIMLSFLLIENVIHSKHGATFFGLFLMYYFPNLGEDKN